MTTTESTIEALTLLVKEHRVYEHPMFEHWAQRRMSPTSAAAMFHQIQHFCASTRFGLAFPQALHDLGLRTQAELMADIETSESGHGPDLAMMAGHIVNRCGPGVVFENLKDQAEVERGLKDASDELLGHLPAYEPQRGLTKQARAAIAVFRRRERSDFESTMKNLGTAFALELISNQSLIPGEKRALIDSGHYGVSIDDDEMHYLREHWGECGAEQQHENHVRLAVAGTLTAQTEPLIREGIQDFLESLAALWDLLDSNLLAQAGQQHERAERDTHQGVASLPPRERPGAESLR